MKSLLTSLIFLVPFIFVQGLSVSNSYMDTLKECYRDLDVPTNNNGLPLNYTNMNHECVWSCVNLRFHINSTTGKPIYNHYPQYVQNIISLCIEEIAEEEDLCTRGSLFGNCYNQRVMDKDSKTKKECGIETNMHVTPYMNLYNFKHACYNRCLLINYGKINIKNELQDKSINMMINNDTIAIDIRKKCNKQYRRNEECIQAVYRELCVGKELNKVFRLQYAHHNVSY